MSDFIIIGCGKAKRDEPTRALDLYTGPLYTARRRHAEALGGASAILSAAHFLVDPELEIAPYDSDLSKKSVREKDAWYHTVASQIMKATGPGDRIVILASGPYAVVSRFLRDRTVEVPGAGLPLGEAIRFHRAEADRIRSEAEASEDLTAEQEIDWWHSQIDTVEDAGTCEVSGRALRLLLIRSEVP